MRVLIAILLFLCMFAIYIYAENKQLKVRKYKISANIPKGKKIKIVHISDIHKNKYPKNWSYPLNLIKNLQPDVIFITGDLVSRTETNFEQIGVFIKRLCEICPVYCINGNHELDLSDENMNEYRKMLNNSGAFFLENAKAEFVKEDIKINIYGASLKKSVYKNKDGGYKNLEKYTAKELEEIFGKPESPSLLLAHNPIFFNEYAKWGADITFSGHIHGGIINTPKGGLLSPERKFFPKYTKGVYKLKDKNMIVSTGIGKLRIFNPPEIIYLLFFF